MTYRIVKKGLIYRAERKVWWGWKQVYWTNYAAGHVWLGSWETSRDRILKRIEQDRANRIRKSQPPTYEVIE